MTPSIGISSGLRAPLSEEAKGTLNMTFRTLTCAFAAAVMTFSASAQAAASLPSRDSTPVAEADALSGNTEWLPVLIFALAVISIMIFEGGDGDDDPVSP